MTESGLDSISREHSLTIEEIFGFDAARNKTAVPAEKPESELTFVPHRVFINHLNSYVGHYLVERLCEQIFKEKKSGKEEGEEQGEEELEEEEEIEEEDSTQRSFRPPKPPPKKLQIVGTVSDRNITKIDDVYCIYEFEQTEYFLQQVNKCGVIIYDITHDNSQIEEALWVLQNIQRLLQERETTNRKEFNQLNESRFFILISTVMTWALTRPMDPDDPEVPFSETDYRKRKPHPNYKEHIKCEKEVVKLGKSYPDKLKTIVIASGITYGFEEEDLNFLFKMVWLVTPLETPIFHPGRNIIPLIHIADLISLISLLIKSPPNKPYILAIEQSPVKLRQIVTSLSKTMGSGETRKVPKEEMFLNSEVTQTNYERSTVNLNMQPGYITEINLPWRNDMNLVENILAICQEYKESRKLAPIKIFIHGPPASGKTRLARLLCNHYRLHYISVPEAIRFYTNNLNRKLAKLQEIERQKELAAEQEGEVEEEDDEGEEEEPETIESLEMKLTEINAALNESETGRLDNAFLKRILKERLLMNSCRNQGYVLDGYPRTMENAKDLFELGEDDGDDDAEIEGEGDSGANFNKKITPYYVVSLQATDEFLCERVMNLPEEVIQGTHYEEEHMLRRLNTFRTQNTDEETVLNFFDEVEIHPIMIPIMDEPFTDENIILEYLIKIIGGPTNFGPSKDELIEMERIAAEQQRLAEKEAQRERDELNARLKVEHETKMEHWTDLMMKLQKEETELLAVQSEPLRNYLIKFVFPTLTRGLFEVARLKPNDPIDYLAEYLFRENPQGRMFDPAYRAAVGEFMEAVQLIQDAVSEQKDELGVLRHMADSLSKSSDLADE